MHRWLILSLLIFTNAHAKELAVTIDDLPVAWSSQFSQAEQKEIFNGILKVLQKYRIKIVGFTIADHIKSYNKELLNELVSQGRQNLSLYKNKLR